MSERLRAAWARWKKIAEAIAHVQARIIFGLLYVIVVAPFAIGLRMLADPLDLVRRPGTSRWKALDRQTLTLASARRQ